MASGLVASSDEATVVFDGLISFKTMSFEGLVADATTSTDLVPAATVIVALGPQPPPLAVLPLNAPVTGALASAERAGATPDGPSSSTALWRNQTVRSRASTSDTYALEFAPATSITSTSYT